MTMLDRIPSMTDAELTSLRANAARLSTSGSAKQQTDAAALLPVIEEELATRTQAKADAAAARRAARPKAERAAAPKKAKAAKVPQTESQKADAFLADVDAAIKRH